MGLVVHIDLSEQILTDFANGLDLSPPMPKQGSEILEDYDDFMNEDTVVPFIFEDILYEKI